MILEQEILIFNQYFSLKRATKGINKSSIGMNDALIFCHNSFCFESKIPNSIRTNKILFTSFLLPRYNKHRPQKSIQ